MYANYTCLFNEGPKHYKSPLEPNDHPKLNLLPELDDNGIQQYQSLIGSLQWAVTITRFDVGTAVMTMSGFRANPRVGHLERPNELLVS